MKIKKAIMDRISNIANNKNSEIGGILGASADGIVIDMVPDLPEESEMCRFEYYPNVDFLNKKIEEWAKDDIDFAGLFHTHFSGSKSLSEADKVYINAIMDCAKEISKCLFFPIFTLPDNELTVYKAYFSNDEIVIEKDELVIA